MMSAAFRPFMRTALRKCVLSSVLALAACTVAPSLGSFGIGVTKSVVQFSRGRLDRLWVVSPESLVMVQRSSSGEGEQIIGLDNTTTLAGDNFLRLRAHSGPHNARFDLDALVKQIGGVPTPFRSLNNQNLRNGSDSLGTYFWQEYRSGTQTNCVIAFRRLKSGARSLPQGTRALDVFLRNCVVGSIDEALMPILDSRIGLSTLTTATINGGNRTLSPLAAPRP